jgi:hypothetical protein
LNYLGLLQQEISEAADAAVRKYNKTTALEERTPEGVAKAMRAGAKAMAGKMYAKMGKLLAVASPLNGPKFLEEVHFFLKPFF